MTGDLQAKTEGGRVNFAGNRLRSTREAAGRGQVQRFLPENRPGGQAQLAVSSLGSQTLGEFELLAGATGKREGSQRFGRREIGRRAQLFGGMAKEPALQGRQKHGKAGDVD